MRGLTMTSMKRPAAEVTGRTASERGRRAAPGAIGLVLASTVGLTLGLAGCGGGSDADGPEPAPVTGGTDPSGGDGTGGGNGGPSVGADVAVRSEWVAANNRGVGLMGRYAYDAAREAFVEVTDAAPSLLDVRVNLAIATLNRQADGDEAEAIELLRAVRAEDPDHLRATYLVGLLELRRGEYEVAVEALRTVAERDPSDPYAAYFYGQAIEADDPATALAEYERAIDGDPYLRSAWYRAAGLLRRLGRVDESRARLDGYRELENDPQARMADFVYTEMGEKADAVVIGVDGLARAAEDPSPSPRPAGPVFAAAVPMVPAGALEAAGLVWAANAGVPSVADLNGDGQLDVVIPRALRPGGGGAADSGPTNAVLLAAGDGTWSLATGHPLASSAGVRGVLFGDVNDDGLVDAFFLRDAADQLWRQEAGGTWRDVTDESGVGGPAAPTADGLLVDADHDGDLDVFLVRADGTTELFSHDVDGRYRSLATETGFAPAQTDGRDSSATPARALGQVLAVDLDARRDLDLIVLRGAASEIRLNGRAWTYSAPDTAAPLGPSAVAAVAHDADADGRPELYVADAAGVVRAWTLAGGWMSGPPETVVDAAANPEANAEAGVASPRFAVVDVDGDGILELLSLGSDGPVTQPLPGTRSSQPIPLGAGPWTTMLDDPARGPSVVQFVSGSGPVLHRPGPGRYDFVSVDFRGRTDAANSLRSNAAGIGTTFTARAGDRWTTGRRIRGRTGPGQDLQPEVIGLAGRESLDFIAIIWPDGVLQTEVHAVSDPGGEPVSLVSGETLEIAETQRQLSSCPVIFAWDGEDWTFISDVLGVGGVGYLVGPGAYAPPRPFERFLMPRGVLQPLAATAGDRTDAASVLAVKLHEPMEEVCYLDAVGLSAWDLPADWEVVPDERLDVAGPPATSAMLAYRGRDVRRVVDGRSPLVGGTVVADALARVDGVAAPTPPADPRFIGRFQTPFVLEVAFDGPIGGSSDGRGGGSGSGGGTVAGVSVPTLVLDGWVEYPYSQTNFAAWQGDVAYEAMSIDARAPGGPWTTVLDGFGYPAGMPRRMSVPLVGLPDGATELRLRATVEVYVDHLMVTQAMRLGSGSPGDRSLDHELATEGATRFPVPGGDEIVRRGLPLVSATLARTGFPARSTAAQRRPIYDYANRRPFADMRPATGRYTRLGDVREIVRAIDDASAVFGPGEEVDVRFAAPPAPRDGMRRRFVLTTAGWCKDMDLFTRDGETVEPLPVRDSATGADTDADAGADADAAATAAGGAGGSNPAARPDATGVREQAEALRTRLRGGRG
ncbi:MAG: FG-GAP-like repeat-containing protein [Phycisphaerales bacterium]